jgi:hypothetical protein
VYVDDYLIVGVAESLELPVRLRGTDKEKLWLARGDRWVPTLVKGPGKLRYLRVTNLSDTKLILQREVQIGLWLTGDHVHHQPGLVSVGSRRYAEWQTLAWEATTDAALAEAAAPPAPDLVPAVDRVQYPTPRRILKRSDGPTSVSIGGDPLQEVRSAGSHTLSDGLRRDDKSAGVGMGRDPAPSLTHRHACRSDSQDELGDGWRRQRWYFDDARWRVERA